MSQGKCLSDANTNNKKCRSVDAAVQTTLIQGVGDSSEKERRRALPVLRLAGVVE